MFTVITHNYSRCKRRGNKTFLYVGYRWWCKDPHSFSRGSLIKETDCYYYYYFLKIIFIWSQCVCVCVYYMYCIEFRLEWRGYKGDEQAKHQPKPVSCVRVFRWRLREWDNRFAAGEGWGGGGEINPLLLAWGDKAAILICLDDARQVLQESR